MKATFNSLVKITNQYDTNLEYNQLNNYTFWYVVSVNGVPFFKSITSNNMNIFNSYLQSAGQFLYTNFSDSFEAASLQIQSHFIRDNGNQILPDITDNAVTLYRQFFR